MRKSALIVLLLIIALSSTVWAIETTGTYEEAKAEAARLGQPLLVDFYTVW